jgi:phage FluMu protein Com
MIHHSTRQIIQWSRACISNVQSPHLIQSWKAAERGSRMSKHESTWNRYVEALDNSTRGHDGEDTVRCDDCNKRIETMTVSFSRYNGEPLCPNCHQAEEAAQEPSSGL